MATVLNRITKELLRSVHEPSYPESEWIHAPDLSAVSGLPVDQWVVDGDVVRPASEGELVAIEAARLEKAKAAKIVEIDARSPELLAPGVVHGNARLSLSDCAQLNLVSLQVSLASGMLSLPQGISTTDGGEYVVSTVEDFRAIALLALGRVRAVLDRGRELRLLVKHASDMQSLQSIVDDRT